MVLLHSDANDIRQLLDGGKKWDDTNHVPFLHPVDEERTG